MEERTPLGLTVSGEEYKFLSEALLAMADQARQHGARQAASTIKRFVVRLRGVVFDGPGIPEDRRAQLEQKLETAFAQSDLETVQKALWALLDLAIRTETDPAAAIATRLVPILLRVATMGAVQQNIAIASTVLDQFAQRLEAEGEAFQSSGWTDGEQMLDYVRSLATFCAEEIREGLNPFGDEDEDPATEERES